MPLLKCQSLVSDIFRETCNINQNQSIHLWSFIMIIRILVSSTASNGTDLLDYKRCRVIQLNRIFSFCCHRAMSRWNVSSRAVIIIFAETKNGRGVYLSSISLLCILTATHNLLMFAINLSGFAIPKYLQNSYRHLLGVHIRRFYDYHNILILSCKYLTAYCCRKQKILIT